MKKLILSLLLLTLIALSSFAQPDTLWTKVIGEPELQDGAGDIQQLPDGSFIVTGGTAAFGALLLDVYLIKINSSGDVVWSNTFTNPGGPSMSGGYSVKQTTDGGYIILAQSYVFGGSFDGIMIKTDASGNEEWIQSYDSGDDELVYEVAQTSDGGYIFAGGQGVVVQDHADGWLVKTDASGNVEWEQLYGGDEDDAFYALDQTSDGGYVMFGFTQSYGLSDSYMWMVKADANGNEEWNRSFGGGLGEWCYDGMQTSDGGYIMTGYTLSYSATGQDAWLVKTDAAGNEEWSQNYGGQYNDYGNSVKQTPDGGYVVGGYSSSFSAGGDSDFWIFKTDADGVEEWNQSYGGTEDEDFESLALTTDDGYILAGMSDSFDEDGDVYLVRLEGSGSLVEPFGKNAPSGYVLHTPYPNPFNNSTILNFDLPVAGEVNLAVYDITGREIMTLIDGYHSAGAHEATFDGSGLSSGIYFAVLNAGGHRESVKMVLLK